jgi:hypothetical protein
MRQAIIAPRPSGRAVPPPLENQRKRKLKNPPSMVIPVKAAGQNRVSPARRRMPKNLQFEKNTS